MENIPEVNQDKIENIIIPNPENNQKIVNNIFYLQGYKSSCVFDGYIKHHSIINKLIYVKIFIFLFLSYTINYTILKLNILSLLIWKILIFTK